MFSLPNKAFSGIVNNTFQKAWLKLNTSVILFYYTYFME